MSSDLALRLQAWAQNEEMVDTQYTQHGSDCLNAAADVRRLDYMARTERYPFKDYQCWKMVVGKNHIVKGATPREALDAAIAVEALLKT